MSTSLPLRVGTSRARNTAPVCGRCGQAIKPPRTDRNSADLEGENPDYIPMCFTCKTRPCEGWSAYCHQCQCKAQPGI
jgi:hypothetical protein